MLSCGQPGTNCFCCLKPLQSPCWTAGTTFPDRLPDRMVWLCWCLMVITKRIFQDHIQLLAETGRELTHNLSCIVCSRYWNQTPLSSSPAVSNVTKPMSAEAKSSTEISRPPSITSLTHVVAPRWIVAHKMKLAFPLP